MDSFMENYLRRVHALREGISEEDLPVRDTYFPIRIEYKNGEQVIIHTPEEIPSGVPFMVIECKAKESE